MTMGKLLGETYEDFYKRGGWIYDRNSEAEFLAERIVRPLRIERGSRILELGCGTGLHAWLLHRLGMRVTAIDSSAAAIAIAKERGGCRFACREASEFLNSCRAKFDVVFARGMSWFHYELEPGVNSKGVDIDAAMSAIKRVMRQNGLFVLQIRSDFSGSYHWTGIRNHTWAQSRAFLRRHGNLKLFVDWFGVTLLNAEVARRSKGNLLGAIRCP
jgi:SAM-dependent methyltransferase